MFHFQKFNKIYSFHQTIKDIQKTIEVDTVLEVVGHVKLHGTNAGVGYHKPTNTLWAQSRERIITIESDNYGFAYFVENNKEDFIKSFQIVSEKLDGEFFYVFGEWAGKGIQNGVAISQTEKTFYPFEVLSVYGEAKDQFTKVHDHDMLNLFGDSITNYKTWKFSLPVSCYGVSEAISKANEFFEQETLLVEEECPVAKEKGVIGIGEGIVWRTSNGFFFKTKGEKHSTSFKKTDKELKVLPVEDINAFVESTVTSSRLQQGITKMQELGLELSPKTTGDYIKWVSKDILEEDKDLLLASGLEWKQVAGSIAKKARDFYLTNI